ncbi:MAG: lipopolysaccharide heptosyltransferase II [Ignavibacteriae bacterium]|nr:lipopolysaccharide heptosyltransferase II [Ignavibacteriota bacterium]
MNGARRFLVFHTAFIGDLVLTLPVTQALRAAYPDAWIGVVAIPAAGSLLHGHPSIDEVIVYDKKGTDRGVGGFFTLVRRMRALHAATAIVPHRSLRSALAVWFAGIPRRVGFTTSAAAMLFTDRVPYDPAAHEVDRNLALLGPVGVDPRGARRPVLPLSSDDAVVVDRALGRTGGATGAAPLVALAPGSVWFTKRWPARHFASLAMGLSRAGCQVVLIGGKEDRSLCGEIAAACTEGETAKNMAGELTLRQSAELLRRCRLVVTNDSSPLHIAGAVGTTTFAIFGATVPAFGFGPLGPIDRTFGVEGLSCRPCAIHGGDRCPIGTFDCMERLDPDTILRAALDLLHAHREER